MDAPTERAHARSFRGPILGRRIRRPVVAVSLVVVTVVLAAAPYVWMYGVRRAVAPVGWDTPTYVWRTRIVSAFGADVLPEASPYAFHSNGANPDRPGLPVLGALLSSAGVSPWRFMFVVPAVAAAVAALSAGAFAVRVLAEPAWALPLFGAIVAWSPQLAVTANGYLDNLLVAGVLLAAIVAALASAPPRARRPVTPASADGGAGVIRTTPRSLAAHWAAAVRRTRPRDGIAMAVALLAGALLIHWVFAAYVAVVLAATAAVTFVAARRRPTLDALDGTPERLLIVVVGAVLVGAAALAIAPARPAWFSSKPLVQYLANLSRQIPFYRLAITLPLAAVGAWVLWGSRAGRPSAASRRRALWYFGIWLVPLVAGWLLSSGGTAVPIQRLLAFSLPVPLLCAAAVAAAVRFASRSPLPPPYPSLAAGLVAATALVVAGGWVGAPLAHAKPGPDSAELARRHTVVRYLEQAAGGRAFVLVVDGDRPGNDYRAIPALHQLRAAAPAALSLGLRVYLGDPRSLLEGVPTRGRRRTFERTARLYWSSLDAAARAGGVAVAMGPYYPHVRELDREGAGAPLAAEAIVIRGPAPTSSRSTWRPRVVTGFQVVVWTTVVLAVLMLVGAGWSRRLWSTDGLLQVVLAPALGIVVLIVAGLLWSRAGLSLGGIPGGTAIGLMGALGWAPEIRREIGRRARRQAARGQRQGSASSVSTTRSTSSTEL